MGVVRERQVMPLRPQRHLEGGEGHDAHRHRLIAQGVENLVAKRLGLG